MGSLACAGSAGSGHIALDSPRFPSCLRQGHLHDRYGQLVSIYTRLLLTKISFHAKVRDSAASAPHHAGLRGFTGRCVASAKIAAATARFFFPFTKHPEFPPGLEVSDEVLEKTAGTDVNNM